MREKDYQINGIDCIFKNTIEENFHKIGKDTISMQIQETNRTSKRQEQKKKKVSQQFTIIKIRSVHKTIVLKGAKE